MVLNFPLKFLDWKPAMYCGIENSETLISAVNADQIMKYLFPKLTIHPQIVYSSNNSKKLTEKWKSSLENDCQSIPISFI